MFKLNYKYKLRDAVCYAKQTVACAREEVCT